MNDNLSKLLIEILKQGLHGDAKMVFSWLKMYERLLRHDLPDNLIEFTSLFNEKLVDVFSKYKEAFKDAKQSDIDEILAQLENDAVVERVGPYHEYRLKEYVSMNFHLQRNDVFFMSKDLENEPLQFTRSRIQNYCDQYGMLDEERDELVIAITEAAENAIKYSDKSPIVIEHGFTESDEYFISVVNSIADVNVHDEIERGKFSEQVSLMRGVLVMSKLLDKVDLHRDEKAHKVSFLGKRKLRSKITIPA